MRLGRLMLGAAMLMALTLPGTVLAGAGSGDPDPNFGGGDGFATIGTAEFETGDAVAVHDGKIIVAGNWSDGGDQQFFVGRLEADGDPDTTFGGGDGIVLTQFGQQENFDGVAVLPNGRIIAVGYYYDGAAYRGVVVRYTASGNLDSNFGGGDGIFHSTFGMGYGTAMYEVALLSSGKFYVTGEAYPDSNTCDMALWRFKANGTPDSTFSGDGMARINRGSGDCDGGWRLLPLANGDVVVGGWSEVEGNDYDVALARWNGDGSLDRTFGYRGFVTYNPTAGDSEEVEGLALANNRIYVAVRGAQRDDDDIALLRIKMRGGLDVNFGGGDGEVVIDLGGDEQVAGMVMDDTGRLVFGGTRDGYGYVARVTPEGALDTSFNSPNGYGLTSTTISSTRDIALQPNGRIVIAGNANSSDVFVARFMD